MGRAGTRSILVAVAVALGVAAVAVRVPSILRTPLVADDFTPDYVSSRAATGGEDPYGELNPLAERLAGVPIDSSWPDGLRNPHPPAQIALFHAISWLPYRAARLVWLFAMAGLMIGGIGIVLRRLGATRAQALAGGTAALWLPVVQRDLSYGQIGGLFVFLIALVWARSAERPHAGAWLGVATALKLFPAFLALPLLRRKRYAAVGVAVATTVAVTAAGIAIVGWDPFVRWLTEASTDNARHWSSSPVNISLPGVPLRWLAGNDWNPGGVDAPVVTWILVALVMAACLVAALRTPARQSEDAFLAAIPLMVLASPIAGDLTLPLVLPTLIVTAARRWSAERRLPASFMVAAAVLLVGSPPWLPPPQPGLSPATLLAGYALPTYALVVLAAREWIPGRGTPATIAGSSAMGTAVSRMRSFG